MCRICTCLVWFCVLFCVLFQTTCTGVSVEESGQSSGVKKYALMVKNAYSDSEFLDFKAEIEDSLVFGVIKVYCKMSYDRRYSDISFEYDGRNSSNNYRINCIIDAYGDSWIGLNSLKSEFLYELLSSGNIVKETDDIIVISCVRNFSKEPKSRVDVYTIDKNSGFILKHETTRKYSFWNVFKKDEFCVRVFSYKE